MKPAFLFCVLGAVFLAGCRSSSQYTSKPVSGEQESPDMRVVAWHRSDSASEIFLQVANENILYKRPDTSRVFYAQVRVAYQLVRDEPKHIIDSSSFYLYDMSAGEQVPLKKLVARFSVPAVKGHVYRLHVELFDLNRRSRYEKVLTLAREDVENAQNFLVKLRDSVAYRTHFSPGDELSIYYPFDATSLTAEYFRMKIGPARPPFSSEEIERQKNQPDSIFTLARTNGKFLLRMPDRGFVHVRAGEPGGPGLTLSTFDDAFPAVGSADAMIECARYIMSRDEAEECRNAPDKKAAIDRFWLGLGGSNERARELLKRYYGRVQEANRHFSTFTEGWKTDRGMIFIIFGGPANIYRSKKDEVWVYGNEANPAALRFVFVKVRNAYTANGYEMERSQFYKDPWYGAVDYWRQGHVYSDGRK